MGTVELLLFGSCLGHFVHAQLMPEEHNAIFSQMFFERIPPYPLERPFDLLSYPDFSLLNEVPPFMRIPKVQVFCDNSELSLLVDRIFNGGILDAAQIELGDGCYSNGRLPNKLVFIYSFDQCGTKQLQQNGLDVFFNILHFHLKEMSFTGWTPPTVQVTCAPKRSGLNPYFLVPTAPLEHGRNFNMKMMNPSWTNAAMSNVFERGQLINLQVFANTKPGEQLFIQSCYVLMSPNPQSKPKPAVIFNKGCTANLHAAHALVHFVASHRLDVVNFAVNTSYLTSGTYIRCSLLISEQGVTSGSKSCNYNIKSARWEELSGNIKVCQCCNSMCRGISPKRLPYDARGIVATGPFLIVDKHVETEMSHSIPEADYTQSAVTSALADMNQTPSLPGVTQEEKPQNDLIFLNSMSDAPRPSSTDRVLMNEDNNGVSGENSLKGGHLMKGVDVLAMFDGWVIHPEKTFVRKPHRNGRSHKESLNVVDLPRGNSKGKPMQTNLVEIQQQESTEMEPIIRSKLQLSSLDGTQMLTYDEVIQGSFGMNGARKCKKCLSNLLDLLRKMDKAE